MRRRRAVWMVGLAGALLVSSSVASADAPAAASGEPAGSAAASGEPAPAGSAAAGGELPADELEAKMQAFEASLAFASGKIALPNGVTELNLPDGFRYIGPEDANKVLQAWGNPPDPDTEGMLFTRELGVFEDDSWAVVIQYSDDGHVSDEDAEEIDFDDLLADMKSASAEGNEARKTQGLDTVSLIGWAEPPHYDQASHKLYWAKELEFGGRPDHTLNYAIRVLGRQGVLELNAVAGMGQLGMIKQRMRDVLGFAEFTQGNRYADFNESTDKLATYGLGALVAGGVAAKAGVFKGLLALLMASKKLVVLGAIALFAAVKGLLGRRRAPASATSE